MRTWRPKRGNISLNISPPARERSAGQMLGSLGRMLKCHATVGRLADGIALEVDCREGKVAR